MSRPQPGARGQGGTGQAPRPRRAPPLCSSPRESLAPGPGGQAATKDLKVLYPIRDLGCPGLVYYDNPWKPAIEL